MAELNFLDPAFLEDPYPAYHRLRAEDPVHRHPLGFYVLTRYDDVAGFLRDGRFGKGGYQALFESRFGSGPDGPWLPMSMLFRDPPDHTRLRALVSKAFTPRVVEGLRAHIQAIVDRLLDGLAGAGRVDVVEALAYPLPVTVISELLGVPAGDSETVKVWSRDVARALDAIALPVAPEVIERGSRATEEIAQYFRGLVEERRRRPGDDLLSGLVEAEEAGDRLSERELLATCLLLYVAGHETTVNLIGNGLLILLRHPAERRRLEADPGLLPGAIEELLRYDGPVQRVGRMASRDAEIAGVQIPQGSLVLGLLGAANRDPAHFPEPDRLDLGRDQPRHLAFGSGIHYCLGAPLARIEAQVAIGTVLRRFPALALAAERPVWRPSSTLRGLEALTVVLGNGRA
ncbi:MAG TPA: cytochrome P450 [Methylomirabilota bacterium]